MSQRSALMVSLLLAVLIGAAIAFNRDRLLEASPESFGQAPVTTQSSSVDSSAAGANGQRVVDVTLPVSQSSLTRTSRFADNETGSEDSSDSNWDDDEDGEWDDDDDDDDSHDDEDDDEDH